MRSDASRRTVLKGLGAAGVGISLSAVPLSVGSRSNHNAASAQADEAKSLVCIFLYGGADSANMYVPRDHAEAGQSHATYSATRGSFAVPASSLLGVHDGAFGLHPGLAALASIAESDRLAVVSNVGPLNRPTTRSDLADRASLPQLLYAHNAQQKLWQTAQPIVASNAGWGGAIASAIGRGADLPSAFSISGSVPWLSSVDVGYSRLSATVGIERLLGYDSTRRAWIPSFEGLEQAMRSGLASAAASPNPFTATAAETVQTSIIATEALQTVTDETDVGMESVNAGDLGGRLRTVAQLIANRDALGMPRQVFFVGMGGWDTHGGQAERFPVLLRELDEGIAAFQASLDAMGVSDSVTTFTTSDFGRTLTSNGDGTDHGWGGHAFVWGGAVSSGRYGTFPSLATTNNPDDASEDESDFGGRLIPTTSVGQYGATLARWMGLDETQLDAAFPDLANFVTRDLGFMS